MVKLSIIIVNWNTEKLLMQCINSLVSSINPPAGGQVLSMEIIVVDNGSTDGSMEILKKYLILNKKYLIHLIENRSNLGFSKAVNQGIKESEGETILLLNSDTQVKLDALEKLLDFEEKVRPAVIGAKMLNLDGTVQGSCFYLPTTKRAIEQYWLGGKKYFEKYSPEGKEAIEVEAVSGGAMLISKEVIEKVGMLDERYFFYFEDLDFCRRAKKIGFKIYYLPEAQVVHEHGASGKQIAEPKDQWRRLIPSSKIYHGWLKHYIISLILWIGQKCSKRKER